jgi:hypothetical protein
MESDEGTIWTRRRKKDREREVIIGWTHKCVSSTGERWEENRHKGYRERERNAFPPLSLKIMCSVINIKYHTALNTSFMVKVNSLVDVFAY